MIYSITVHRSLTETGQTILLDEHIFVIQTVLYSSLVMLYGKPIISPVILSAAGKPVRAGWAFRKSEIIHGERVSVDTKVYLYCRENVGSQWEPANPDNFK